MTTGQSWLRPGDLDAEAILHTAVERVLLATHGDSRATPGIPAYQRLHLLDWRAVVSDDQGATDGICCVAAPVWRPDGRYAAVAALVVAHTVPPGLKELVVSAARQIGHQLR